MILRLKKQFLELSPSELDIIWREFLKYTNRPPDPCPFSGPEVMFDTLHEQGVTTVELLAPLCEEHIPLLYKIMGE